MKTSEEMVLVRTPEATIRLRPDGGGTVTAKGNSVDCGPDILLILNAFAKPARLADALKSLGSTSMGRMRWVELTAAINRLRTAGILVEQGADSERFAESTSGHELSMHVSLLNDEARTLNYFKAMQAIIRPDDVVVDVGTGTGVLALAAARAGARRVYAIEASQIADVADAMFKASPFAERITLIRGWSHHLELPERCDVLVSEILGHDPLTEGVLSYLDDVAKRWLKPGGRSIPALLRVFAVPVEFPHELCSMRRVRKSDLERWNSAYGFDFSPFARFLTRTGDRLILTSEQAAQVVQLSTPVLCAEFELAQYERFPVENCIKGTYMASGRVDGFMSFFELDMGGGITHSVRPRADSKNSWNHTVDRLPGVVDCVAGQEFSIRFQCDPMGNRSNLTIARPVDY